jgi:hypothetical protein
MAFSPTNEAAGIRSPWYSMVERKLATPNGRTSFPVEGYSLAAPNLSKARPTQCERKIPYLSVPTKGDAVAVRHCRWCCWRCCCCGACCPPASAVWQRAQRLCLRESLSLSERWCMHLFEVDGVPIYWWNPASAPRSRLRRQRARVAPRARAGVAAALAKGARKGARMMKRSGYLIDLAVAAILMALGMMMVPRRRSRCP